LSRRFGAADKLEVALAGRPLALHAAANVAALPFGKKLAVCAAAHGLVPDELAALGFEIVVNPDPGRGQGSSIAVGVGAARQGAVSAVLICLADMPCVSTALLERLVGRWQAEPGRAVATAGPDYRGPPAIFPAADLAALAALSGDRGAKPLLASATLIEASQAELRDFDLSGDFPDDKSKS
jgi:molybdenum cofactor cytidylyltransferase